MRAGSLAHCQFLGVPEAARKTEGLGTNLILLGIELDTQSLIVRLPATKLARLRQEIFRWESLKSSTKRELVSLIRLLQHACKLGRSFLRRMIELSKGVHELHYRVRLNAGFRSDLKWWGRFLPIWIGLCPMASLGCEVPHVR